jgi:hypothetical protein
MALLAAAASGGGVDIELPGKFGEFRVVNRGAAIRLSAAVKVQQKTGGEWRDTPVTNLHLRDSCAKPAPECVSLGAEGRLQPVPWSGNYCSAQCPANCNLDGPAPPGIYRYVVSSCDHKRRFVSAAFEKRLEEPKGAVR